MATVHIPPLLRNLTGGRESVFVSGATVGQVIAQLELTFPGAHGRLCHEDTLRPGWAAAVDGHIATLGMLHAVGPNSEVHFLPAISGG